MRWLKVQEASREWAGNISPKTMYAAIKAGKLQAARIGAGRNFLVCEQFVDEWLSATATPVRADAPRPRQLHIAPPKGASPAAG